MGDSITTDTKSIANASNYFFSNIGNKLAKSIPEVPNISPLDYLPVPPSSSFYLSFVTSSEIEDEIDNINSRKATGPFSIPTKLLKLLKHVVSKPLEILFNYSFSQGKIPSSFKIARVILVCKKGSPTTADNYRPNSLLSIFNRILETLMYKGLVDYLEKINVLCENQFGFRNNHSVIHTLILIADKIQKAIGEGNYACGIFLDLSKAFDMVTHSILLKNLKPMVFEALQKSRLSNTYLTENNLCQLQKKTSDLKSITCGVPQGSVLGPLLFLIYINDITHCSDLFELHLFADDTNLFYSNKNLSLLESSINTHLEYINLWLSCNKLSLNVTKTNFVIFHTPQKSYPLFPD